MNFNFYVGQQPASGTVSAPGAMVTSQDIDDVGEMGAMFMAANRSKRGLALDYREPDGLKALLRILAQADSHGRVCH